MGSVTQLPPRGHYLANEVGALAGVSGDRVGQWAHRSYIRASQSKPGDPPPLVYSFQDVAEAMLVHELEDQGVPLAAIRWTIEGLRQEFGDWPLQSAPLEIDQAVRDEGEPIAALTLVRSNHREEIGEHGWQLLEDVRVNPKRISLDLARGGWAVRVAPDLEHIEVDPDRLSGRPTIRGRRVPVSLVSGLADDEGGVEILHEDYDLNDYEIGDARCRIEVTRSFANAA